MIGSTVYSPVHADAYDAIYRARGKDRTDEARVVIERILAAAPEARSLLDVGCGTGAHLGTFAEVFEHTEGLDYSEPMVAAARARLGPSVPLHHGDMCEFDLGRTFDAVVCLFCTVSYAGDLSRIRAAIANMAAHLAPGGVLVVEPWWFSDRFIDGYVNSDVATDDDGRVFARVSHSVRVADHTRMSLVFLVADDAGIRSFNEEHRMTLCTREEYLAAFTDAGLRVEYHDDGPGRLGLFVGVRS
jgi:SAM-dependent methyltransferase